MDGIVFIKLNCLPLHHSLHSDHLNDIVQRCSNLNYLYYSLIVSLVMSSIML